MEITDLRAGIDAIDAELIALFEKRMDVSAQIAAYKRERGLPVLDSAREAEKLADVAARCRPETSPYIPGIFRAVMAASRAYQTALTEERHE